MIDVRVYDSIDNNNWSCTTIFTLLLCVIFINQNRTIKYVTNTSTPTMNVHTGCPKCALSKRGSIPISRRKISRVLRREKMLILMRYLKTKRSAGATRCKYRRRENARAWPRCNLREYYYLKNVTQQLDAFDTKLRRVFI